MVLFMVYPQVFEVLYYLKSLPFDVVGGGLKWSAWIEIMGSLNSDAHWVIQVHDIHYINSTVPRRDINTGYLYKLKYSIWAAVYELIYTSLNSIIKVSDFQGDLHINTHKSTNKLWVLFISTQIMLEAVLV